MIYQGGCHCGKVRFEVEGELDRMLECNCSICASRGSLLWFVPRQSLNVQGADADIGTYTFNKGVIRHRFCQTCGIHVFGEGADPKGTAMAAINVRCIDGVDLASIPIETFDGRSL